MQNLYALTGMLWFDSGGFAVGRRISIRQPWAKGHAERRRDAPEQSFRGGAAPALAKSAPQWSVGAAIWLWGTRAAYVIHWSGWRGARGWSRVHGVEAARRGGTSPAGACSCREGGLRAKPSNATERGGGDVAH